MTSMNIGHEMSLNSNISYSERRSGTRGQGTGENFYKVVSIEEINYGWIYYKLSLTAVGSEPSRETFHWSNIFLSVQINYSR